MDIWVSRLGIRSNDPAPLTGLVGNLSLFALWLLPSVLAIISEKSSMKEDMGRGDQVLAWLLTKAEIRFLLVLCHYGFEPRRRKGQSRI